MSWRCLFKWQRASIEKQKKGRISASLNKSLQQACYYEQNSLSTLAACENISHDQICLYITVHSHILHVYQVIAMKK